MSKHDSLTDYGENLNLPTRAFIGTEIYLIVNESSIKLKVNN